MSVTERDPALIDAAASEPAPPELLEPREVPLGGPRAMRVQRTLPQRSRSLIGAWCFLDHYGPDDLSERGGMQVPGHPHTGLATVTWLFEGEVEHRDTTGAAVVVRPGEVNLMTAGRGVAHSEFSVGGTTVIHGAQLWFALPAGLADGARSFEHAVPEVRRIAGAEVRVFVGDWLGSTGAPHAPTPLIGAEVRLLPGLRWEAAVDPGHELGVLVDSGEVVVEGLSAPRSHLVALSPGRSSLTIEAGPDGARVLVLAGEPFPDPITMWWNFVGRDHDDIVAARAAWQEQVEQERATGAADGRFGPHPDAWDAVLPAPDLPTVRLKPRIRR
ncbi:pirin family protein [Amnibacterium setariae]|uniref:pirin family protein n=1 Tax=Amnibacterium setariae TaxID=2306585 RepID=UPI001F173AE6|nr:pirin family protein [Amnibacterium setariae]